MEECLDSILNQTLQDIEVICINDGSTDRSIEILGDYQESDRRVRVINQENGGYGRAINVGLAAARGQYVGIVEADDFVLSDMYRTLWEAAREDAMDFVKSDYAYFRGKPGERSFDRVMICPYLRWYGRKWEPDRTPALLDADMMNVTGIYRREFLREHAVRLRETPGASFQDTGFWLQIFLQAKSAMFLQRQYYCIRRDNPNSSVLRPEKFLMICDEYDAAFQALEKLPPQRAIFAPHLFKRQVYAYQFMLSRMDRAGKHQALLRLARDVTAARRAGIYDATLFSAPMNHFLKRAEQWDGRGEPPAYVRSNSPPRRAFDCLREHGTTYMLRQARIRFGFQERVF